MTRRRVMALGVAIVVILVIVVAAVAHSHSNHSKELKYYECLREEGRDPHAQLSLLDNARVFCGGLFGYSTGSEPGPEP